MKIVRGGRVDNPLHQSRKPVTYDIVRIYCRYCQEKLDLRVYHSRGKFETYQIVNLPEHLADHLDTRKIECTHCDKNFVLEKNIKDKKTDYLLKLDCSNMQPGMESWYADAIPNMSGGEYQWQNNIKATGNSLLVVFFF